MRLRNLLLMALLSTFILAACGGNAVNESEEPAMDAPMISDVAGLVEALEAEGASVEMSDPIEQPFFSVVGQGVVVNEAALQVFEYADAKSAAAEAETISADGSSVGTSMMMWMDAPHFYLHENLIVLYVGSDAAVLELLEVVLGPQIAGQ